MRRATNVGASDFYVYSPLADPKVAFESAIADAQWESGRGGYTGTIAEKAGYGWSKMVHAPHFDNPREAMTWANDDLEERANDHDKWGPAWAVPVYKKDTDFKEIRGWIFYGLASY
jgi:hypothetical protein